VLQPHQMDALKWMASLYENGLNGILADDMGMGKTIQAISILAYMHESLKVRKPHLIVAPKSTISNWMKEFKIWAPFFRVVNLIPTAEHRDEILRNQMQPGYFDICVTTYDAVLICEYALKKYDFHYIIFDEAHKLKNSDSTTTQTSRRLKAESRLLMTGTPLQNDIGELWSLLNMLMPQLFTSKDDFKEWFDFSQYDGDNEKKMSMVKKLHKILRPFMLRRVKADLVTKLPDKIEINISVQLTPLQIDLYAQFLTQVGGYSSVVNNIGSSKQVPLKSYHNILMQLRKVCNHPYLFEGVEPEGADEFGEHLVEASGKLILVDKLTKKILPKKEQILIFSCFTQTLNILEDFCCMREIKYSRLDGSTSLEDRDDAIQEFTKDNSECQVFLISTRAGGLGINLYTANHVVLYDSDWNPQIDLQAMDRAHRIGQKKNVYVYRLITASTVEEKIIERQAIKLKLDQVVIQQGNQVSNKSLSKEEYERVLLHGAAAIMKRKQDKVVSAGGCASDIDIDQLISEGETRYRELKKQAEDQIESTEQDNAYKADFTFNFVSIDQYMFQDKDFREEKKKVQAMIQEQ
jgi:SWI/SNF-related matrix-associated actin-dependent regulator of chromatin subfamily A member 5